MFLEAVIEDGVSHGVVSRQHVLLQLLIRADYIEILFLFRTFLMAILQGGGVRKYFVTNLS